MVPTRPPRQGGAADAAGPGGHSVVLACPAQGPLPAPHLPSSRHPGRPSWGPLLWGFFPPVEVEDQDVPPLSPLPDVNVGCVGVSRPCPVRLPSVPPAPGAAAAPWLLASGQWPGWRLVAQAPQAGTQQVFGKSCHR